MSNAQQNWVLVRADCTSSDVYFRLTKKVKEDIAVFNRLPAGKRGNRQFLDEPNGVDLRIYKAKKSPDTGEMWKTDIDDCIHIRRIDSVILIERQHCEPIAVTHKWNEETLSCDYLINGSTCPLWKVSQKILLDFLFPEA